MTEERREVTYVKDRISEKSGIITNLLLTAAVGLLGWMNVNIIDLNKHVAVIQEVNNRQDSDIKKLETWRDSFVSFPLNKDRQ